MKVKVIKERVSTEIGDKVYTKVVIKERCGRCGKAINKYWKCCPYCTELIER